MIVETYLAGYDHRMLVVNGQFIAVAKRVPKVTSSATETAYHRAIGRYREPDPRRGIGPEKVLTRLELDDQAARLMEKGGVAKDTILEKNQIFYLRSTGNLSTGGTAIDLTDQIHPDNKDNWRCGSRRRSAST